MPESKSGTIAANVTTSRRRLFRPRLQFCGSSSESVGWGHSTLVPSLESFSRAATASPNSIFASLSKTTPVRFFKKTRANESTQDR